MSFIKKVLTLFLPLVLLFTSVPYAYAEPEYQPENVDKMNEKQLISLFDSYIKKTVRAKEAAIRKKENIIYHKVLNVKKLSKETSDMIIDTSNLHRLGKNYIVFYLAVDYKLTDESKYRLNGINYRLMVMVKETANKWSFFSYEYAPVHVLVKLGHGFGTDDEKQMAKITELHNQGIYINREGKPVGDFNSDNIASEEDLRYEITGNSRSTLNEEGGILPREVNPHYKRPKFIRVLMKHPTNRKFYGCSKPCVQRLDFLDYLKHVLPVEWNKEAPPESLKAGALAVKMYAWHSVAVNPKAAYIDADIDDTTNNQVYAADFQKYFAFEIPIHNPNLNAQQVKEISEREGKIAEEVGDLFHNPDVAGIGVKENVLNTLVDIGHMETGTKGSGIVSQSGSMKLADNQKMLFFSILEYYMNGSKTLPKDSMIQPFRYAK
jgi:hypothetical protein